MFEVALKEELSKYYPDVLNETHPDAVYLRNILLHLEIGSVLFTRLINELYPDLHFNRPIAVGSSLLFILWRCRTTADELAGFLERNNLLLVKFFTLEHAKKQKLRFENEQMPRIFKVLLLLDLFIMLTDKLQDDINFDLKSHALIMMDLLRREKVSATQAEQKLRESSRFAGFTAIIRAYEAILIIEIFAFNFYVGDTFEEYVKNLYNLTSIPILHTSFTDYYLTRLLNPERFGSIGAPAETSLVPRTDSMPSLISTTSSAPGTPITSPAASSRKSPALSFGAQLPPLPAESLIAPLAPPIPIPTRTVLARLSESSVQEPTSALPQPWPAQPQDTGDVLGHIGSKRSLLLL